MDNLKLPKPRLIDVPVDANRRLDFDVRVGR